MKSLPRIEPDDVRRRAMGLLDFAKAAWGSPAFCAIDEFTKKIMPQGYSVQNTAFPLQRGRCLNGEGLWARIFCAPASECGRRSCSWRYRILLENDYVPGDLEAQIKAFAADYNHLQYHEAMGKLTPAGVYFGRSQTILIER
jgi:hypothetical protein